MVGAANHACLCNLGPTGSEPCVDVEFRRFMEDELPTSCFLHREGGEAGVELVDVDSLELRGERGSLSNGRWGGLRRYWISGVGAAGGKRQIKAITLEREVLSRARRTIEEVLNLANPGLRFRRGAKQRAAKRGDGEVLCFLRRNQAGVLCVLDDLRVGFRSFSFLL